MKTLSIKHLISGGIITNYFCTSSCKHCLYNSSPYWPKDYMDAATAERALETCRRLGCKSVHIGGGEPFLNFDRLKEVLAVARRMSFSIEYVETNSSWYTSQARAVSMLKELKGFGLKTLLVSASPFHLEYIPFKKVTGVVGACQEVGIYPFIWTEAFFRLFLKLDPEKRYSISEAQELIGKAAFQSALNSYWIHPGGRAAINLKGPGFSWEEIVRVHPEGCSELMDTSHFHMDLYGNFVPGLCSGLAIRIEDLGRPIDASRYPLLTMLYNEGIGGFLEFARKRDFDPKEGRYSSKCGLCLEIRRFLSVMGHWGRELAPGYFYRQFHNDPEI